MFLVTGLKLARDLTISLQVIARLDVDAQGSSKAPTELLRMSFTAECGSSCEPETTSLPDKPKNVVLGMRMLNIYHSNTRFIGGSRIRVKDYTVGANLLSLGSKEPSDKCQFKLQK
jgi:hypothetical protein